MTITVDIKPEVQAELERRAASMESDPATYAAGLIESALEIPKPAPKLTPEGLKEFLREMAKYSDEIHSLPDEAFTRESIYQDHD